MVTIGMNYFVIEGKEAVFEGACEKVLQVMSEIEGHEKSELFRRVGDGESVYLIVSRWHSEDAFNGFIASDQFKKVTNWGKQNILSARPRHTTYKED